MEKKKDEKVLSITSDIPARPIQKTNEDKLGPEKTKICMGSRGELPPLRPEDLYIALQRFVVGLRIGIDDPPSDS